MAVPKTILCIDCIICKKFGTRMTSYRNMKKKPNLKKNSYLCMNIWSKSLSFLELMAVES